MFRLVEVKLFRPQFDPGSDYRTGVDQFSPDSSRLLVPGLSLCLKYLDFTIKSKPLHSFCAISVALQEGINTQWGKKSQ